ncbi:MAG: FAD:protein FMN transferase [Fibrobacteres bacterium]|nr:FAD:protein FMN transferase [Fibrobacterota bacterium]
MIRYIHTILISALFLFGCKQQTVQQKKFSEAFFAMDTRVEISAYTADEDRFRKAVEEIYSECTRIEELFSTTTKSSYISELNNRKTPYKAYLPPEAMKLLTTAIAYSEETKGLFDVTIAPVKWLWGLGTGQTPAYPDSNALAAKLKCVGWKKISIQGDTVFFTDSSAALDLGGIAKGYSLTKFKEIMLKNGINSFLVNAGGDVLLGDPKPDGQPWRIGIKHPRGGEKEIMVIPASNTCIISSGDYERFFFHKGERYHHIFNPFTGMPTRGIISSTVVASDPVRAVIYSKVMMLKGVFKLDNLPDGIERAVLIDESLNISERSINDKQ